ncbi:MAG: alpha-L-fucosidase [Bacteroidota bacterium]
MCTLASLKKFIPLLTILVLVNICHAQVNDERMQWFADAKYGIFIHWGIYSLGNTSESWAFYNKQLSHADYMAQINQFRAENYNPTQWAKLIKQSGARYAVITAKHHDGVALWDTKFSKLSVARQSPASRDVLSPFIKALREQGIKVGIYYSLIDWSHPDYPGFTSDSNRYSIPDDTLRWQRFLKFCHGQIEELMQLYNPDLMWFDGDWEHSANEWQAEKIRELIHRYNPNTIINGRLQGYGDYDTPEQNFPVTRPNLKYWELCMTMNTSWGYRVNDTIYKTPFEIISILTDAISMGGNLLLDITPKANGLIPQEQIMVLCSIGEWIGKHSEAIYGTLPGLPQGHFYGPTSLSNDSTSLFLFLPAKTFGQIMLKGISSTIKKITVLGTNHQLQYKIVGKISWSPVPGLIFIDVPKEHTDSTMTVIKVEFNEPIKLYRGKGGLN